MRIDGLATQRELPPLPELEETQLTTNPSQRRLAAFTYSSPNGL
jgi:hypothetical protein